MKTITRCTLAALVLLTSSVTYSADTAAPVPAAPAPVATRPLPEIPKPTLPSLIPGVGYETFPKMDGSSSAYTLEMLIWARAAGMRGELRRTDGPWRTGQPNISVVFPLDYTAQDVQCFRRQQPYSSGTHEAYLGLLASRKMGIAGAAATPPGAKDTEPAYYTIPQMDIIVEAREQSADELKAAKEAGVEFDVRPVALDAFVFFDNAANPVKSLTIDQIRGIYTGKIANWKEVGGKDAPITAYTRDRNSGSEELMNKLVLKGEKSLPLKSIMVDSMMGPIEGVANTDDAIAYSVYYYEHIMSPNRKNELLAINGVLPTPETIANRKYPLTAEVYVVTRKGMDPASPAVKLRDWLLSDDGQRLVAESGYVPIRKVKAR